MRYCPFCAEENQQDARECAHCGKRIPAAARKPTPVEVAPTLQIDLTPSGPLRPEVKAPNMAAPTGTLLGIPSQPLPMSVRPPTPTAPTRHPPEFENASSDFPSLKLPPMPMPPESGSLWRAVSYLPPLLRAWWVRVRAARTLSALVVADQRTLDGVLRDLGRAAREAQLDEPVFSEEMGRVHAEENRRDNALESARFASEEIAREAERFRAERRVREAQSAGKQGEIAQNEDLLRQHGEERRAHATQLGELESQLRAAERRATQGDAKALKLEVTSEDKGGGIQAAAAARLEAEAARKEASSIAPLRDQARAKVMELDGPIGELERNIARLKQELQTQIRELKEAEHAHELANKQFETDQRAADEERASAEREMSQRFITVGTLLNLNRIEGDRFRPLYLRIDQLKGGLTGREALIQRLAQEREAFDRPAMQKGLLTVGAAIVLITLIVVILSVVLSR